MNEIQNFQIMIKMMASTSEGNKMIKDKVFTIPDTNKEEIKKLNGIFNIEDEIRIDNKDISLNIYGVHIRRLKLDNEINNEQNNEKNNEKNNERKCIIFSHGTSSDIYNIYSYLQEFSEKYNVDVITYDYPCYGLSTSSDNDIHEKLCYTCHENVVEYALDIGFEQHNIILIGQSLGTGVVVDYVNKSEWTNQIVLISPYTSIPRIIINDDIVDNLTDRYNFFTLNKIHNIKCGVYILHGNKDDLIPHSHSIQIFNKLNENIKKKSKLKIIHDAGHGDIMSKITDENVFDMLN